MGRKLEEIKFIEDRVLEDMSSLSKLIKKIKIVYIYYIYDRLWLRMVLLNGWSRNQMRGRNLSRLTFEIYCIYDIVIVIISFILFGVLLSPDLTGVILGTRNDDISLVVELTTEYLISVSLQNLQALPILGTT
jgi:hypothetical protein